VPDWACGEARKASWRNYVHARHKGPAEAENPDDYADLIVRMRQCIDIVRGVDKSHALVALNQSEVDQKHIEALKAVDFASSSVIATAAC